MDFGNIIFWLLLLFLVMFSFFNKFAKKANQRGKSFPTPVHRPESLPEISTWHRPEPVTIVPVVGKKRVEFQSSLDLVSNSEGEKALSDDAFIYHEIQENSAESVLVENQISSFSTITIDEAKKAIVYSEILQRKY